MPTRILSWQQLVLEADPGWHQTTRRPWVYETSHGRRFYERDPVYDFTNVTTNQLRDEAGNLLFDEAGNALFDEAGASQETEGHFIFGESAFGDQF